MKKAKSFIQLFYLAILIFLLLTSFIVALYILHPIGNVTGIVQKSGGSKYGKRISFLVDYVKSTGNIEIATGVGISEDELNNYMGGDSTTFDKLFVKDTVAGIGLTDGTLKQVLESYRNSNPTKQDFYGESVWATVEAQGKQYVFEKQLGSSNRYRNPVSPSVASTSSAGCFLFALAAAATNMTGCLTTVQDIIDAANVTTLDGSLSYADSYLKAWSNLNTDVTGLKVDISAYTSDSSWYNPDLMSGMLEYVKDGKMVIIYANECSSYSAGSCGSKKHHSKFATVNKQLSSGGHHWLLVVGIENDSYIVLCNGNRTSRVNIDYVHEHIVSYGVVEEQ